MKYMAKLHFKMRILNFKFGANLINSLLKNKRNAIYLYSQLSDLGNNNIGIYALRKTGL